MWVIESAIVDDSINVHVFNHWGGFMLSAKLLRGAMPDDFSLKIVMIIINITFLMYNIINFSCRVVCQWTT